jgi:hypothetical protein
VAGLLAVGLQARARFGLPSADDGALAKGWEQSLVHPALSAAGRQSRKMESLSAQELAGLSSSAIFLPLRMWLAPYVSDVEGVSAEYVDSLLALALEPPAWNHLRSRCDEEQVLVGALNALLCEDSRAAEVEQAVDAGLAAALAYSFDVPARFREAEEDLAVLAAEVAAGLGSRGTRMARGVLEDGSTPGARALAVYVLARTLSSNDSASFLQELAGQPGPLSVVASLELARLGAADLIPVPSSEGSNAADLLVRFAASGLERAP